MVEAAQDDAGEVDWLCEVAHQGALNAHHIPPVQIKHTDVHTHQIQLWNLFVCHFDLKTHILFATAVTSSKFIAVTDHLVYSNELH